MHSQWDKERYRREQEDFVSNYGGSTPQEIICVILPCICSILLATTTIRLVERFVNRKILDFIEFVLTIVPYILCCTILSKQIILVCVVMISASIGNVLLVYGMKYDSPEIFCQPVKGKRPFITNFRSMTNILTAVCILAVDFKIFPRRFAKTEVNGYSLMDAGVGLFVFANALVAPEARDFSTPNRLGFVKTFTRNVRSCTKSCTPLLLLGFGRMAAIELIGYQKHITEYGIHWNFFITLAFVKFFTNAMTNTINSKYSLFSGIWIIAMHEYILSMQGLKDWVLGNNPRDDFVSANREGLVSIPGYIGLYLVGIAVGRLIHSTYQNSRINNSGQFVQTYLKIKIIGYDIEASYNESMILCIKLSLISAQTCAATLFCDSFFGVSRRLANAGYCAWILTLGTIILTLLLLIEIVIDIITCISSSSMHVTQFKNRNNRTNERNERSIENRSCSVGKTLEIFEAVNYNGLFFFLFSNVMTGAINMAVRTLYVDQMTALEILIGYMAVNIVFVMILYRWRIQIKL